VINNKYKITALIPAYNEEKRIGKVLSNIKNYVDEVVVIDDASGDNTVQIAKNFGAIVIENRDNLGYLKNIIKGINLIDSDIIITIDADGEHPVERIPELVKPIVDNEADLVLGRRRRIPRLSEKMISFVTKLKTGVYDAGTGFRAFRKSFTKGVEKLKGSCTCGVFVLFFYKKGARIKEVDIKEIPIEKPRGIAWRHFNQFFVVLRELLKK
jgi:glycosyltransferase involved in cell wall biosynthesis